MKRIVSTVLAVLLLICCLSGCGGNKSKVSSDYVSYGENLVILLDDYIDAKQTAMDIEDNVATINSRVQLYEKSRFVKIVLAIIHKTCYYLTVIKMEATCYGNSWTTY